MNTPLQMSNNLKATILSHLFFYHSFQDEPHGEEGINAEAQYWGGSINPLPQAGQAIQTTSSIKMMTTHPPAHPAPWYVLTPYPIEY